MKTQIEVHNIYKQYNTGSAAVHALTDVSLDIARGEFVALSGPSGSGKSTLMNIIGAIDQPTQGSVLIDGKKVDYRDLAKLHRFRLETMGFIFQSFNLIPIQTAAENIEYPLLLAGIGARQRKQRLQEMLESVGLTEQRNQRPNQLSGGQKQRVAIARALINHPKIVLADEPTANLDSDTSRAILDLLHHLNKTLQVSIMVTTHDPLVFDYTERTIVLRDGHIVPEEEVMVA